MSRKELIKETIQKLKQFPETKIQEVLNFVSFLESRIADNKISESVKTLTSGSKSKEFLNEGEEDLY